MKKILPIVHPPITTFPGYANTLAILCTSDAARDWIFAHYLQIYAIDIINRDASMEPFAGAFFRDFDTRHLGNTLADYVFLRWEGTPNLLIFEIPCNLFQTYNESFVSFIKRNIDLNLYLYCFVDITQIDVYNLRQNTDGLAHEMLIFGYDDEKEIVHFADFIGAEHIYNFTSCSYTEIEQAFMREQDLAMPVVKSIAMIRHIDSKSYAFSKSYLNTSIAEYLHPDGEKANEFNDYVMDIYGHAGWKTKTYTGIDVYDYLIKYISDEAKLEKGYIDHRLYHAMYDHKVLMKKRLEYLWELGHFTKEQTSIIQQYDTVVNKTELARNLLIKHRMQHNNKTLDKIPTVLWDAKDLEISILNSLFPI